MFESMGDYFVNQIKIAKHFYLSEYKHIDNISTKSRKKNIFGFMVDRYMSCLAANDLTFFETESGKNIKKHIEDRVSIKEKETDGKTYYQVEIDTRKIDSNKFELNIRKAALEYEKASQMLEIHNNNAIISLLIRFESFLHEYFFWLISNYPDKYLQDKNIRYSDLVKYKYDEVRNELIRDTVNNIMRQSLSDWLKIMKSHKFDLDSLSEHIKIFSEVYCRRNIVVHNNGEVNREYLSSSGQTEEDLPIGKKLLCDKEYIVSAYDTVMILIYGILYSSLKANVSDAEDYIDYLFNSGFQHMIEEDWHISLYIFGLLIDESRQSQQTKILAKINYWISCKNLGHFDKIVDDIKAADFSAMNTSIQMAKEMLLENYETAIKLLDEAISLGLSPDVVPSWPIFRQFRKTKHYKNYQEKYSEQLKKQLIDTDELDNSQSEQASLEEIKHAFNKDDSSV